MSPSLRFRLMTKLRQLSIGDHALLNGVKDQIRRGTVAHHEVFSTDWQHRLAALIDVDEVHMALAALLGVDCLVILLELVIVYTACGAEHGDAHAHAHLSERQHGLEGGLHIVSVTILFLLLSQLLLEALAYGSRFFKQPVHILDLVIILVAIALETGISPFSKFVVVVLAWRCLRVIHAMVAAMEIRKELLEDEVNELCETVVAAVGEELDGADSATRARVIARVRQVMTADHGS